MQRLVFLVQGSQIEPYRVTFEKVSDTNLNAYCTCPAGDNGQYCKHRFGLMNGEVKALVSGNGHELPTLAAMLAGSDIETAYQRVIDAERIADAAKKQLAKAKKDLAGAMRR